MVRPSLGLTRAADGKAQPGKTNTKKMEVEIVPDEELLTMLCRRGNRRLRELQGSFRHPSCKAVIKFDRTRGVLRVTGTESATNAVRRQLECWNGPRVAVPAAVWAELMRTRTMPAASQPLMARIQEGTGCRIHIERSRLEVRLFAPEENAKLATQLLEELSSQCIAVAVDGGPIGLPDFALEAIANAHGVTIQVDHTQYTVLGIRVCVEAAARELREVVDDPSLCAEHHFTQGIELGVVTTKLPPAVQFDGSSSDDESTSDQAQESEEPKSPVVVSCSDGQASPKDETLAASPKNELRAASKPRYLQLKATKEVTSPVSPKACLTCGASCLCDAAKSEAWMEALSLGKLSCHAGPYMQLVPGSPHFVQAGQVGFLPKANLNGLCVPMLGTNYVGGLSPVVVHPMLQTAVCQPQGTTAHWGMPEDPALCFQHQEQVHG